MVRRDDGEIVLADEVRDRRGSLLGGRDFRPVTGWLDERRTSSVASCRPGAVSAEVTDDLGTKISATAAAGAYVAIIQQPK